VFVKNQSANCNQAYLLSCTKLFGLLILFAAFSVNSFSQSADSHGELPALMPVEREVALAKTAAPEYISSQASVYVLKRGGFVTQIKGTNGFTCLVLREAGGGIAPICYDAEGSQTIFPSKLYQTELLEQGKSWEEAEKAVYDAYAAGRFRAPRHAGIAYMLSTENHLHDPASGKTFSYPPHLMIYAPYAHNADIGATNAQRGSTEFPWVLHEGKPDAFIMVVPGKRN
jgi:hypothetical protein